MEGLVIIYLAVGLAVAVTIYIRETKKVREIDEPMANIATIFAWSLWPVVAIIWLWRWVKRQKNIK